MSTIRILLGLLCFAAVGCGTEPSSGILRPRDSLVRGVAGNDAVREKILGISRTQIGIREATGNNDGQQVEAYLKVTNLPKGNPWCAAFVSWVFKQAGYERPRTAWSPALFPLARQPLSPKPADVLGIYSIRLKRIAHAGLVERRQDNWIISIEGNTNTNGSREGDGVYRKRRHVRTIATFADWVR